MKLEPLIVPLKPPPFDGPTNAPPPLEVTTSVTEAVAVEYVVVSVGVNVTERVWLPAVFITVPAAGL
jgi:hypothetical protein